MRDRVDGGADDEGAVVLVAIFHLDLEGDLPGSAPVDPQGAFGAVAGRKLPGAFEQDAVPAKIPDDRCYPFLIPIHREREIFPAWVWNFVPLLLPIVDRHRLSLYLVRSAWVGPR